MQTALLGIITYDVAHLKTEELLYRLIGRNIRITLFTLPYKVRPARQPLFIHRPDQSKAVTPDHIAQAYGVEIVHCKSDLDIDNRCDSYLVAGAGILSRECIYGKKIINAHPGVIPAVRGLDAFKWAILEMQPLGATLHTIDAEVDCGNIISIRRTDVYSSDTLEILARRHYENEIDLLANYETFQNNPKNDFPNIEKRDPHMRMKKEMELQLFTQFEKYKQLYAIQ